MNYRDHEFELDGGTIELELQWSYYHLPAKLYGPPENCYPEEEESEVLPPVDLAYRVKAHAEKMIPIWIKQIEGQCMNMELDDKPREWWEEERDEI